MSRFAHSARLCLLAGALLAGCATAPPPKPVYHDEAFNADAPFQYQSAKDAADACELGKRALLSQGYQIDDGKAQNIKGEKYFQPNTNSVVKLVITLVCLGNEGGAVIYGNALQTRFELKAGSASTGFSVAGVGSISLPWTGDKENLVKVGEETVIDPDFYRRLFGLIEALEG